jgi:hypothetical protein
VGWSKAIGEPVVMNWFEHLGHGSWDWEYAGDDNQPTHWLPIPPLPTEQP